MTMAEYSNKADDFNIFSWIDESLQSTRQEKFSSDIFNKTMERKPFTTKRA